MLKVTIVLEHIIKNKFMGSALLDLFHTKLTKTWKIYTQVLLGENFKTRVRFGSLQNITFMSIQGPLVYSCYIGTGNGIKSGKNYTRKGFVLAIP